MSKQSNPSTHSPRFPEELRSYKPEPSETSKPAIEEQSDNEQALASNEVEYIDEEKLANVTGGGGILDVLKKGYYATGDTFSHAPTGGSKLTAIKPQRGRVNQEGGRTEVLYHGGGNQYTGIAVQNPQTAPKPPSLGAFHKP